jgi:hypothetical protein
MGRLFYLVAALLRCVSVVIFPKQSLTTETQRTQRLHREEHGSGPRFNWSNSFAGPKGRETSQKERTLSERLAPKQFVRCPLEPRIRRCCEKR